MLLLNIVIMVYAVFALGCLINHYFPFKLDQLILPGPVQFVFTSYDDLPEFGSCGYLYIIANSGQLYFWDGKSYREVLGCQQYAIS